MNKKTKTNKDQAEADASSVSEEQITSYLAEHSDFFDRHPELLASLNVPHAVDTSGSGRTVSLIERQVGSLRNENAQLKQQLNRLIDNARTNDQLFEKANSLIISLIGTKSVADLQKLIDERMISDFGSACCRLWLIDGALDIQTEQTISTGNLDRQIKRVLAKKEVFCGLLKDNEKETIFTNQADLVGSAAIIPLSHQGQQIAILAIANADRDYYRDNMGTSLLNYIGEVVSKVLYQISSDSDLV